MSDWEVAERRARIDHIERLLRRGASVGAVLEEMAEATRRDVDAARKRASKHGSNPTSRATPTIDEPRC